MADLHILWLPNGEAIALTPEELQRALKRGECYQRSNIEPSDEERLVTSAELANLMSLPKSWIEEAARQGRIPSVILGKYRRFRPAAVIAALELE
jgi:excisionase family DNA binding protein